MVRENDVAFIIVQGMFLGQKCDLCWVMLVHSGRQMVTYSIHLSVQINGGWRDSMWGRRSRLKLC